MGLLDRALTRPLLALIRLYQLSLSLLIGRQCRFEPTCSHYTAEAIKVHGVRDGSWLGIKRILRCHPWHEGGIDPVPESSDHLHVKRINTTLEADAQSNTTAKK